MRVCGWDAGPLQRPEDMMPQDAYRDFADRYDLFFEEFGRHGEDEVNFFRRVFEANGVERVHDCACGTGHDLVMLEALGVKASGSDISVAMLDRARRNLAARGLDVLLDRVDFRELRGHYTEGFDAVVCLSTSLLEVGDRGEVLRALRSMRGVLRDGGVLVLSQGTTDKQWKAKPRFIPVVSRRDFSRIMAIDYLADGTRYNILDLFHGADRTELVVWSREYPVMLLRDDYDSLLGAAGFGEIDFYGGHGFEPYDKAESDMLLVVAKV